MRSRYTAYTQANIAYIKATMCGNALQGFSVADAARWADRVTWRRLVVHSHRPLKKVGYVEFSAFYDEAGKEQELYERSAFKKVTGQWYYVGRQKPQ
jgi:SEC-C motif-containing protein